MVRIHTEIPNALNAQLAALASQQHCNEDLIIRQAIEYYLALNPPKSDASDAGIRNVALQRLSKAWDNDEDAAYDQL